MKFLFFDLEDATFKNGVAKICEFGYVITDENFEVLKRYNLIINPNIADDDWDQYVVENILTRPISFYNKRANFDMYYYQIKKLIDEADYIIGHSLDADAKALNDECTRYNLPCINFDFWDVKEIYKQYTNTSRDTGVVDIMNSLNIKGEENQHDAETDAFNTMLELKEMLRKLDLKFTELIQICPNIKNTNKDFELLSMGRYHQGKRHEPTNSITGSKENKNKYKYFLEHVTALAPHATILQNKKLSISDVYENNHYSQMLNLAQIIKNAGGTLVYEVSKADIYVSYEGDDGERGKYQYVRFVNYSHNTINVISFEYLLEILSITKQELNQLPLIYVDIPLDYELDMEHSKRKVKYKVKDLTIGDLFEDKLLELMDDLVDDNHENK